jgi:hypothetical protein
MITNHKHPISPDLLFKEKERALLFKECQKCSNPKNKNSIKNERLTLRQYFWKTLIIKQQSKNWNSFSKIVPKSKESPSSKILLQTILKDAPTYLLKLNKVLKELSILME